MLCAICFLECMGSFTISERMVSHVSLLHEQWGPLHCLAGRSPRNLSWSAVGVGRPGRHCLKAHNELESCHRISEKSLVYVGVWVRAFPCVWRGDTKPLCIIHTPLPCCTLGLLTSVCGLPLVTKHHRTLFLRGEDKLTRAYIFGGGTETVAVFIHRGPRTESKSFFLFVF